MPELPEVQTVVSTLRPKVSGVRVGRVRLHRTDIVSPDGTDLPPLLEGRTITGVERRAKRIVFTVDGCDQFYVHLGMTGQLTVEGAGAPVRTHTHLVVELEKPEVRSRKSEGGKQELRFRDPRRFGGVFWLGCESAERGLGPEPLTLKPGRLGKQLAGTRRGSKGGGVG